MQHCVGRMSKTPALSMATEGRPKIQARAVIAEGRRFRGRQVRTSQGPGAARLCADANWPSTDCTRSRLAAWFCLDGSFRGKGLRDPILAVGGFKTAGNVSAFDPMARLRPVPSAASHQARVDGGASDKRADRSPLGAGAKKSNKTPSVGNQVMGSRHGRCLIQNQIFKLA